MYNTSTLLDVTMTRENFGAQIGRSAMRNHASKKNPSLTKMNEVVR